MGKLEFDSVLLGAILGAQDGSCRVRDATGVDHPAVPRKSIRRVVARALVTASLGESAELDEAFALDGLTIDDLKAIDERIDERVFDALSVDASVAARASYGGTAPVRVREQVAAAKQRLAPRKKFGFRKGAVKTVEAAAAAAPARTTEREVSVAATRKVARFRTNATRCALGSTFQWIRSAQVSGPPKKAQKVNRSTP